MSLVEKELTQYNIEQARNNPEFEKRQEVEQKFAPLHPELFVQLFKDKGEPISQGYLSHPDDEFSLRFKKQGTGDNARYSAALKDRGEIDNDALKRTEIPANLSEQSFAYYQEKGFPIAEKIRTEIMPGVTADFYDDKETPVVVEIENDDPEERAAIVASLQEIAGPLINKSDDPAFTTEAIAYRLHAKLHPELSRTSPESLDALTQRIVAELVGQYVSGKNHVVASIDGMPGSGKTTVTQGVQEAIVRLFGEQYKPVVVSTDDYHFGKTYLEATYGAPYVDWDESQTYNTKALERDLQLHAAGTPLIKRHFSFESEETILDDELPLSPFVLVEGLYAGSPHLDSIRTLHFELPTSIATSIGRDVRRLCIENRANRVFPTPESRLEYLINSALPRYLEKEKPERHRQVFSGCVRPLAERAVMLAQL